MEAGAFFIRPSQEQLEQALASWQWLPLAGKKPCLVTAFGNIFFEDAAGTLWFLDSLEGVLVEACRGRENIESLWATSEGGDRFLDATFVELAYRGGKILGPGECFYYNLHPALGGGFDESNIGVWSFAVVINIAGQIHCQINALPPGFDISGINLK